MKSLNFELIFNLVVLMTTEIELQMCKRKRERDRGTKNKGFIIEFVIYADRETIEHEKVWCFRVERS